MGDDLHWKLGWKGRFASFVSKRRAAGDPYEETVVLPAIVLIAAMHLGEKNLLGESSMLAIAVLTPALAGVWLGFSFSVSCQLRIVLRASWVGVIQTAGIAALSDTLDRQQAIILASNIAVINIYFYWVGHTVAGSLADSALITEAAWQAAAPKRALIGRWRAWIDRVLKTSLFIEEVKGSSYGVAIAALILRVVGPTLILAFSAWLIYDVDPVVYLEKYIVPQSEH